MAVLPIISLNTSVEYMDDMSALDEPEPIPKAENIVSGLIWRTPSSVLPSKIWGTTL